MKKIGRNDPCPCGSGKKFKKCCESTMLGGRFKASKVEALSAPKAASVSRLTGLFKAQVAALPAKVGEYKSIQASASGTQERVVSENSEKSVEKAAPSEEAIEKKEHI